MLSWILMILWISGIVFWFFRSLILKWKLISEVAPGVKYSEAFRLPMFLTNSNRFNQSGAVIKRKAALAEGICIIWFIAGALLAESIGRFMR